MLISIDHGNKQVKTIHHAPFTSGLVCSEVRPFGGETLAYQGRYYTLTDQRIPYRRDKTEDERFFVLTLFAIAYELEAASFYGAGPVRVQLAVGLPPAHYGAQQKRFAEYFLNRGTVSFTLHDKQYEVLIDEVSCYPQSYAAAITVFQTLQSSPRALIIDIGGFTADYLLLRNGEGDLSVCDSLENGVILLYNRIKSRVAAEQDLLLDETEIDAILLGRDSGQSDAVLQIVRHQAREFVSDLLSSLRERMLELKSGKVIFTGGGAVLLQQQIEASDKVREPVFIEDIAANVKAISFYIRRNGLVEAMDTKKDPGKFTIRFCMSDPRQKRAVEELNAQGRLKAQFLTNAILHYVGIENNGGAPSRAELETIVRSILENIPRSSQAVGAPAESKVRSNATPDTFLTEENLNTIAGTLKAFRR